MRLVLSLYSDFPLTGRVGLCHFSSFYKLSSILGSVIWTKVSPVPLKLRFRDFVDSVQRLSFMLL